jgi:thioredoxin reductase
MDTSLPVAVLGAGPVGLAAASRLLERGLRFVVVEAAASVGANLMSYGHVRLFSPWRYDIDDAMAAQLRTTGWQVPAPEGLPLARELVEELLQPFADLPAVRPSLRLGTRVVSISREGYDKVKSAGRERAPFVIRAVRGNEPVEIRARAVVDATGTWATPNPLGANGLPADGESAHAERIFYGIPDVLGSARQRYAGQRTLVVGSGHSAAHALIDLATLARSEPGTAVAWATRATTASGLFGGGAADGLPARGQLGGDLRALSERGALEFHGGMRIAALHTGRDGRLVVLGIGPDDKPREITEVDQIICAAGQRPDLTMTSELRLKLDPWLESTEALGPLIDPNLHSCGTVPPHGHRELSHPEPGFYTVGVKSYGRAPTFLMVTGYEQVRSVVAAIAGDLEAADKVALELPETGVCSAPLEAPAAEVQATGCCGGPPKSNAAACCVLDEEKKAAGEAGCGCASPSAAPPAQARAGSCCPPARSAPARPRCCG